MFLSQLISGYVWQPRALLYPPSRCLHIFLDLSRLTFANYCWSFGWRVVRCTYCLFVRGLIAWCSVAVDGWLWNISDLVVDDGVRRCLFTFFDPLEYNWCRSSINRLTVGFRRLYYTVGGRLLTLYRTSVCVVTACIAYLCIRIRMCDVIVDYRQLRALVERRCML
jgi:hypothetical protein